MTDLQALSLVLALLHVAESFLVVRNGSVVLRPSAPDSALARPGFTPVEPDEALPALRSGVVFTTILPPLAPALVLQAWPVSMSGDGLVPFAAAGAGRRAELPHAALIPWETLGEIHTDGPRVLCRGREIALCVSESESARLADLIEEIASLAPADRETAVRAAVAARFNKSDAEERVAALRGRLPALVIATNVLFALVTVVVLALAGVERLSTVWVWFALAVLPVLATTTWLIRRAHRALHESATGERRRITWVAALSPLTALRGVQTVARDALSGTEPIVAVRLLGSDRSFQEAAQRASADFRTPRLPAEPSADPSARRTVEWFRECTRAAHETFLRAEGVDIEALLAPPERRGTNSASWCPRCRAVYSLPSGACADCGGVPLRPF